MARVSTGFCEKRKRKEQRCFARERLFSIINEMDDVQEKPEREPKLKLKATWQEIYRKQKGLVVAMIALLALSVVIAIVLLFVLHPKNSVVIVGYGDVYGEIAGLTGGYRRDSWLNLLAFPLLAVVLGVVHNVIAIRVYRKYGKETALMTVFASMLLLLGIIVIVFRLIGEW